MDSAGTIMFWVIVELDQKAREISDTDFGLNIFGNIKLAKSSQLTGQSARPLGCAVRCL